MVSGELAKLRSFTQRRDHEVVSARQVQNVIQPFQPGVGSQAQRQFHCKEGYHLRPEMLSRLPLRAPPMQFISFLAHLKKPPKQHVCTTGHHPRLLCFMVFGCQPNELHMDRRQTWSCHLPFGIRFAHSQAGAEIARPRWSQNKCNAGSCRAF